jgi:hypothetical protein
VAGSTRPVRAQVSIDDACAGDDEGVLAQRDGALALQFDVPYPEHPPGRLVRRWRGRGFVAQRAGVDNGRHAGGDLIAHALGVAAHQ